MSEQDLAWEKFRNLIKNDRITVDVEQKYRELALKGSVQTQKLKRVYNTQRSKHYV